MQRLKRMQCLKRRLHQMQMRERWLGALVVDAIRHALNEAEVSTEPDFEAAYIDSPVYFRLRPVEVSAHVVAPAVQVSGTGSVSESSPPPEETSAQVADPTFRLSKLAAANQTPLSVKPDATLAEAVTLMMSRDYSQLPIMTNERDVRGAISWRSIATRLALRREGEFVRDFMDPVEIFPSDASLFEATRVIVQKQYVLVRASDRKIVGIVTSSDLSEQFQALTEPFLLLAEIENDLRRVLSLRYSSDELEQAKDPKDDVREIGSAHSPARATGDRPAVRVHTSRRSASPAATHRLYGQRLAR